MENAKIIPLSVDGPQFSEWLCNSGDWLSLDEAAARLSEQLGSKKAPVDVLKAGYLEYLGIEKRLKIYAIVQNVIQLKVPLHCEEPAGAAASWMLFPGDAFRMSQGAIEQMALARRLNSDMAGCIATRTLASDTYTAGWVPWRSGGPTAEFWLCEYECLVTPCIELVLDDLRIDGADLDVFGLAALATKPARDNSLSSANEAPVGIEWKCSSRAIAAEVRKEKPLITVEKLSEKVQERMAAKFAAGESGMTGRGGKVPSAETIKRHGLAIKRQ